MEDNKKDIELIKFYFEHFKGDELDNLINSVLNNSFYSGLIKGRYDNKY